MEFRPFLQGTYNTTFGLGTAKLPPLFPMVNYEFQFLLSTLNPNDTSKRLVVCNVKSYSSFNKRKPS